MNKNYLKVIIFIVCFNVEIRVKASDETHAAHSSKSAIKSDSQVNEGSVVKAKETLSSQQYKFSKDSIYELTDDKKIKLISGFVWVMKSKKVIFETPYGDVQTEGSNFWVFTERNQYRVRNVDSKITIILRDKTTYEVPKGFEVWFSGLNQAGLAAKGMIEPVNISHHLKVWSQMYPGSPEEFKKEVRELKEKWKGVYDSSSQIYQSVIERQLSSLEEQKKKKKQVEHNEVIQRNYLKQKYFETTFSK